MKKREDRTKLITVRCAAGDYARIREHFGRTKYKYFSVYLRKMLLREDVEIVTRDLSLDGLIDELIRLREERKRLLELPALNAGEKQRLCALIQETIPLLNKIADQCILKLNSHVT